MALFFLYKFVSDSQPLQWALKCGGDHFKSEKHGSTDPLEYAAQIGHLPSVKHLIEKCHHNKQLGGPLHQVRHSQKFKKSSLLFKLIVFVHNIFHKCWQKQFFSCNF
jgi:hypothetical protein